MARGVSQDRCGCSVIHTDVVDAVRAGRLPQQVLQDAAAFFRVMGDGTRFMILWSLDRHEMCVCDLAAVLGMSKSAVSHQLRRLREGKLVTARREGKMVFYAIADEHVHLMLQGCIDHACEAQGAAAD
ncbi:MAG: ArsR/SmtB family transcription factor [Christensenellales bacterium]